jgi:cytochrome c oxidase assembly protein subunit 15
MHFALVATVATLILLPLGGAVTGFEAGLAVPDWPSSFGYNMFLFPLAKMTGGVYFEHSHRLFGSLVGLTTMTLAAYLLFVERRKSIRVLAVCGFIMVVVQGIMGALRVTELNRTLGVIHGVFGQVFFVTLACLGAFLSPAWRRAESAPPHASAGVDRALGIVCLGILAVQLILGAVLRHFNWGLHLHLTFAAIVLIGVGALAIRSWAIYESVTAVSRMGLAVLWILLVQILLGGGALVAVWSESPGETHPLQVLVTTAHQTTGALLLAAATVLVLWQRRAIQLLTGGAAQVNVGV